MIICCFHFISIENPFKPDKIKRMTELVSELRAERKETLNLLVTHFTKYVFLVFPLSNFLVCISDLYRLQIMHILIQIVIHIIFIQSLTMATIIL